MTFYNFLNKFNLSNFFLLILIIVIRFKFFSSENYSKPLLITNFKNESPSVNWTHDYDPKLANFALDFAAAAYSKDPILCLKKHNATLEKLAQLPCDYLNNMVKQKKF